MICISVTTPLHQKWRDDDLFKGIAMQMLEQQIYDSFKTNNKQ